MALSDADRQTLIEATHQHRQRLRIGPKLNRELSLSISELRSLIGQHNAVRVIDNGSGWYPTELATVRHVEPNRGRVTLQFGSEWWNVKRCPQWYVERAIEGGRA